MADDLGSGFPVVQDGSDNVFDDLGIPDADECEGKLLLAVFVNREIRHQNLRQVEAAKLFQCNQAEVSRLASYKLAGISERRLMAFLNALGHDVEIGIRPARGHRARVTVRELGTT